MTDRVKRYHLSPEKIEALLQNNYKNKIEPVDSVKLRQLHRRQELQNSLKSKNQKNEVTEETISL